MNFRKIIAATGIVGALIFTSACSASQAASPAGTSSASGSASKTAAPLASAAAVKFPYTLPNGIVAKGVAYDGKGVYLQTSIADADPAMKYNPANADTAAKAHFSAADLAEAQKVIVRFIAEEAIDSALNGGTDVSGWYIAHKDEIHPDAQPLIINDLKSGKVIIARENWMLTKPGFSYVHGASTPRVTARNIFPTKLYYATGTNLQGVMLDTHVSYSMAVTAGGTRKPDQNSTAELSYGAAKDPADGKWKIAAWTATFHTAEWLK